jgi:hypothetical protein
LQLLDQEFGKRSTTLMHVSILLVILTTFYLLGTRKRAQSCALRL